MMRNIRIEVQKILHLPYLLLGVVGIIALCLTATGDMNAGGSQISIFSLMIRPEVTNTPHTAFELWRAGIGGWLLVFAPMLLTVGYMISLSGERQNGQIRFALMRSGKLRYCISKVCGGALAGGIIFLIGYAVFGLLMVIRFPALSTLPVEEQEMYLMGSSLVAEVVKRLIGAFLYGITGSLFGIGVAIVFRDKYMLICLPFMINYIYQQVLGKMSTDCVLAEKYEKATWIDAMRPESIMNISGSVTWLIPFVVMLVIYILLIGVFYLSMKLSTVQ
ncbi:hypothetical protein [uncultured Eubacterium sp.]|uniref:hypothetical protein n=1 Tax=uncultured Eubacterium sp. TaxID=165185 RepID=UPI0025CDD8EE|nr:hypothetical protein [uncultured Eubacterium sp.]